MNIPGFTAEASVSKKAGYYFGSLGSVRTGDWPTVEPASLRAIRRLPLPFPEPIDICGACISDCIHRGGNSFSCRNLCSFVCF